MQHRRSKRLKRVAAAILSAVLIVTELPQADLVFAAQEELSQTEIFTEEHIEAESQEVSSPEQPSSEAETPETETQVPEQTTETETKESEAASESESETKTTETDTSTSEVETETETESQSETESVSSSTESEPAESETESQEIETTQTIETETTEIETIETETTKEETTEMETMEIETTEEETETEIPVPVVDTGVYEYKDLAFSLKKSNRISIQGMESLPLEETNGKYILNNKDEFLAFINSSSSYSGKTVELNCNIDMKNEVIGTSNTFQGTFDGKGHSIINFRTSNGLFQEIGTGGKVTNLHISGASFDGESSAGIVAGINSGEIENVLVTGNLTVTKDMNYTGGIAGNNKGIINNCVFSGNITADADSAGAGKYIGGIAGKSEKTIKNCYTAGTITGKAAIVAGIAGENNGDVTNCYNYMDISGADSIAGIASRNVGTIEGCRNYGSVNQNNLEGDNGQAGGIAAGNDKTITNCYNYGAVTGTGNNIGGIAGYTANGIAECGNYGAVQGKSNVAGIAGLYRGTSINEISKCFNMGVVEGSGQGIGGILGSADENPHVKLVNCYNTGNISASGDNIGGIAGILMKGSIENCYNAGKLTVSADSIAGAVAGFLGETVTCEKSYFEAVTLSMYNKKNEKVPGEEYRKSETVLKDGSVVVLLGDAFSRDNSNLNNGYPVLSSQQDKDYKYLVVYELNGGKLDKYFDIVQKNATISAPAAPEKAHAKYLGWFSDKALNTAFSSGQISKATILYAGWENAVTVEKIELINTKTKLVKGSTYEIAVKYTPENATNKELIWESGDPSVATVDNKGKVTAISAGNTQITARLADNSLSTVLTFSVEVSVDDNIVWIRDANEGEDNGKDIENLDVAVNEEYTVEAVISGVVPSNAQIHWESTRPEIAKIEQISGLATGSKAKITGVKTGDAIITATFRASTTSEPVAAILNVRVRPLATEVSIMLGDRDATKQTIIYDYGISKFVALGTGKGNRLETPVANLSAEVRPSDAGQKVEWVSENPDILEFTDKYSGKFEIKSNGKATITANTIDSSKKSATVTVDVKKVVQTLSFEPKEFSKNTPVVIDSKGRIVLTSGQSVKLIPIFTPVDATDTSTKWDSISGDTEAIKIVKDKDGNQVATAQTVTKEIEVIATARSMDLGINGDGATCKVKFVIKPKVTEINIYREEDMRTPITDKNIGVNPEVDDKTITLRVKNKPDNSSQVVTWKSSNESIATIKDNKDGSCIVTVKERIGKSTITATATDGSGITAKTTVNVTITAAGIIIKGSHSVRKGRSIQLTAQVEPASAPNKEVTWQSLNPQKAIVNENGKVTGISAGPAQIIATAADGSKVKATHTVIVTDAIKHFKIVPYDEKAQYDKLKPEEVPALNGKTIGLDPDDPDPIKSTYKLDMYVNPLEACQTVTWKSSNEKVATVSEDGTITAVGLGRATVSATSTDGSGKKASVTVNVNALSKSVTVTGSHYVGAGKSIQLKAEVGNKDAANKNVVWSSSNKGVLTVDNTGKVSPVLGKTLGNSVIRAEAADGSGKYAEHKVYIMGAADDVEIEDFNTGYPIKLDEKNKKYIDLDMKDKETLEIQLSAVPSGGTSYPDEQKDVIWSSSNKNVATVTSEVINGKSVATVTLTSVEGSAVITAKTADGYNKKDTCTINVENSNPVVRITGPKQVGIKKKIQLSAGKTAISSWTSSDTSVATINAKGQVTAKNYGEVTFTAEAKVGTNSDTYTVNVMEPVQKVEIQVPDGTDGKKDVTGKKLGMDILKGYEGNSILQLSALVYGDDDKNVTWKSNKTSVAKVDENGTVEALKAGTAKITATAIDGSGKKATVTIVVAKQVTGIEAVNGVLSEDGKAYEVRVAYKKSVQLKVNYLPLAATTKKVTWKVRDEDKSFISVSSTGKVTAKQYLGNYAVVYATAADNGGITCEFRIFVTEPTYKVEVTKEKEDKTLEAFAAKSTLGIDIDINNKLELGARFTTKDGKELPYQGVTWKSGNTKIATVDSNGLVTGLKVGKTTITATAADGTNKSCKINLYVGKLITRIDIEEDALKEKFPRLRKGKTIKLMDYIVIRPITATNQKLTFKSTNKNVLTVNSKGVITSKGVYKKNGITYNKAKIQILTNDGTNILEEIEIEVTN